MTVLHVKSLGMALPLQRDASQFSLEVGTDAGKLSLVIDRDMMAQLGGLCLSSATTPGDEERAGLLVSALNVAGGQDGAVDLELVTATGLALRFYIEPAGVASLRRLLDDASRQAASIAPSTGSPH